RHGHLRGSGHVRRTLDPRALHLVGRHDADATLGAGVLGRRRQDVGDELDHGLHEDSGGIVSALERAVGVPEEDRHVEKIHCQEPSLALDETVLKWYDIGPDDAPVPLAVRALARRSLRDASRKGTLGDLGELVFVVLHRCGESFYFLLVCTWRNENELWETVWAKASAVETDFELFTFDSSHRGTFCVWELGVVWHEQQAWKRFLLSKRGPE